MAAPFAERRVAEPPTHVSFGRRIVRSDGNAQKSLTAPEKRAPAECHKRGHEERFPPRRLNVRYRFS